MSNPPNGSDSWFDFLSRSNPANENHASSSGRRTSSSTWPRNSDNKVGGDDLGGGGAGAGGLFDGRKESAVRGEGGVGEGEVDLGAPDLPPVEERTGEGDAMNDASSDGDNKP